MLEHPFTLLPLRGRRSLYAAAFAALLLGCGPGSETGAGGAGTTGSTSSATSCPRGAVPGPKGACMPVGIQGCADMFWEDDNLCHPSTDKCPAGTIPKLDEGCVPVGVTGCSPEFAGEGMCAASLAKCQEGEIPVPQEGCRPIDGPDDLARYDHPIAMDRTNLAAMRWMAPAGCTDRPQLLLRHFHEAGATDIVDPYGGSVADYERALDLIEKGCTGLMMNIVQALQKSSGQRPVG